jgi:hypothetical protein
MCPLANRSKKDIRSLMAAKNMDLAQEELIEETDIFGEADDVASSYAEVYNQDFEKSSMSAVSVS